MVGAIAILWRLARDLELRGPWVSLPLLAACCPFVLWAASDMRSYGLTLLLTAATTWCFARLWIVDKPTPKGLFVGYVTLTGLSLLTFYYTGFLFAAQLLAAWFSGRRRREAAIAAGIIAVLLLPAIPLILRQFGMHIKGSFPPPPDGSTFSQGIDVIWRMVAIFFDTLLFTGSKNTLWLRPALLLLAAALIRRVAYGWVGCAGHVEAALLALTGLLPFLVLETFDITSFALVSERHRGIIVLPLLVAAALVVDRIPNPSFRAPMGLILSGLVAWFGLSFVRTDRPMQDLPGRGPVRDRSTKAPKNRFSSSITSGCWRSGTTIEDPTPCLACRVTTLSSNGPTRSGPLEDAAQIPSRIDSLVPPGGVLDRGTEADGTLRAAGDTGEVPEERGGIAGFSARLRAWGISPQTAGNSQ